MDLISYHTWYCAYFKFRFVWSLSRFLSESAGWWSWADRNDEYSAVSQRTCRRRQFSCQIGTGIGHYGLGISCWQRQVSDITYVWLMTLVVFRQAFFVCYNWYYLSWKGNIRSGHASHYSRSYASQTKSTDNHHSRGVCQSAEQCLIIMGICN